MFCTSTQAPKNQWRLRTLVIVKFTERGNYVSNIFNSIKLVRRLQKVIKKEFPLCSKDFEGIGNPENQRDNI